MRDYTRKAKRVDNREWISGYLVSCDERYFIAEVPECDTCKYMYEGYWFGTFYEVDPDTICNPTGLTDKNGNKIWENDILEWTREDIVLVSSPYHEGYRLGDKVKVKKLDSGFTLLALKNNSEVPNVIGNVKNYEFWNMQRFLKVIGNIFDNADLLKGE